MEHQLPPSDRLTFIDILKGIGIVFLIMGHMGFGNDFDFYIHGFHMPLFFFVSGYLFNIKRTFCEVISRKFKALIIPYASFGMVALYYFISFRGAGQEKIIKFIKHFTFIMTHFPRAVRYGF